MNAPVRFPKFTSRRWTAKGEPRASIALRALETLWFNTGTLCNITCANCYIESSPRNDHLSLADVQTYLDEIERDRLPTRLIGFTGGEPFMNPAFPDMLEETLSRGFETLTLTNAMRPDDAPQDRDRTACLNLRPSDAPARFARRLPPGNSRL